MKRLFLVLLPLLVGCAPAVAPRIAAAAPEKPPGTHGTFADEKLEVGKQKRVYRLVVPKSVDLEKPAPLVFAFHGMGIDSKDLMPKYTKLDDLAADKKFILVYPEAEGRAWGLLPDKVKADLAFFDELLATLKKKYHIDENRIYVLGMSNGGYFAHLVGKERSKIVAAVASHSGPLGLQTLLGIKADRKFPVMIVHGDKDKLLPVEWARENRDKYKKEGHDVKFVEVAGLGHMWASDQKINEQIWEFFEKNPKR
ncbi:MAG: dienelactone hydrolase family protein [Planctomycetia bacterium]|nr:dienelactone hydrolase family protein [Planctomycetia bacterium]